MEKFKFTTIGLKTIENILEKKNVYKVEILYIGCLIIDLDISLFININEDFLNDLKKNFIKEFGEDDNVFICFYYIP